MAPTDDAFTGRRSRCSTRLGSYCGSSTPGGHGNEKWFVYGNPGFNGVTDIVISTNKEKPWGKPQGGWEIQITGTGTF